MTETSTRFNSFMTENVQVKRWSVYLDRLLFLFFAFVAMNTIFTSPGRTVVIALAASVGISILSFLGDRYGALPAHASIVLSLIILAILAALIWRHEINRTSSSQPGMEQGPAGRHN